MRAKDALLAGDTFHSAEGKSYEEYEEEDKGNFSRFTMYRLCSKF
jgi:hypothetical protein